MRRLFLLATLVPLLSALQGCESSAIPEPAPTAIVSEGQTEPETVPKSSRESVGGLSEKPADENSPAIATAVKDSASSEPIADPTSEINPQDMKKLIDRFLFYPSIYPAGNWEPKNLQIEEVWFETADGSKLHGWYCPLPKAEETLFYAHGNGGNLSHRAERIRELQQKLKCNVFIFDYRGYGRSEGVPTATGIIEDSDAALSWLLAKTGLEAKEIIFLGRSLGGAVAADLVHRHGGRALILENAFFSLREISAFYTSKVLSMILVADHLNTANIIGEIDCPVVISHGTVDRVVPYQHGVRLSELATDPHLFVELPHLDHNDALPDWYYEKVVEFLDSQFADP
ncbi:MAG TPA: alpha/beta hydrolase [Planctomycetaceae bacterium]|nr:alpha/beta hydrolase [Planctomycetaceae bacterium]